MRSYGSNDYFTVLRAFGITDRKPVDVEIEYVDRWQKEYGYGMDMILEAAARTMKAIAKPSFPYTDGILRSWAEGGVRTSDEIEKFTPVWSSTAKQGGMTRAEGKRRPVSNNVAQGKIHFELERDYDFKELEAGLLKKQRNKRYNRV